MTTLLPYSRQWISDEDVAEVARVLQSDFLTTGPEIARLEAEICKVTDAAEAVVCNSGTAALHLATMAIGLSERDVAIVPTLTFAATANAVRYCGAEVVFADVDRVTGLIGVEQLADALTRATYRFPDHCVRAVLPVHLNGEAPDAPALAKAAEAAGLAVIEDTCHALGARLADGSAVGSGRHARFSAFSFHPVKLIAMGEGGAVTTPDAEAAHRMRRLRSHGIEAGRGRLLEPEHAPEPWYTEMQELGFNYRASDVHCALALSQMKRLDAFLRRRRELAGLYDRALASLAPVVTPAPRSGHGDGGWHLYPVRIDFTLAGISRAEAMKALRERGVGTQVHYRPVHLQPYYAKRYGPQVLPGAEDYYARCLSIPLFPRMDDADVGRVVEALAAVLRVRI